MIALHCHFFSRLCCEKTDGGRRDVKHGIDKIPLAKAPFFARESYLPFCGVDHAV